MAASLNHHSKPYRGRLTGHGDESKEGRATARYFWKIRIRTATHLDGWLRECFGGLHIAHEEEGTTLISGDLVDLPEVYGVILQLRDAGLELLSLRAKKVPRDQ